MMHYQLQNNSNRFTASLSPPLFRIIRHASDLSVLKLLSIGRQDQRSIGRQLLFLLLHLLLSVVSAAASAAVCYLLPMRSVG